MEITKIIFMVEVETDEFDVDGEPRTETKELTEDQLLELLKQQGEKVKVKSWCTSTFTNNADEYKYKIEELEQENEDLRDTIEEIYSKIDDLKSSLSGVEYYADEIESLSNI